MTESRFLEVKRERGGNFYQMLNINLCLIVKKYREGKVKSTLERELKVPEIAGEEGSGTSVVPQDFRQAP